MSENWSRFTVYFEEPFWVGVYQRAENGALTASRVVFGAEPRDAEVYQFLLQNWHKLRFSQALLGQAQAAEIKNPKRRQRVARRETAAAQGVGTRAQQALQQQREADKSVRRQESRAHREEENQRKFNLKQQKRKEKHRGH